MAASTFEREPAASAAAFSRLQQELVDVRAQLDLQVSRLTRLNRLSDELINHANEQPLAETFAEAIVDVLDLAVGAVWVFPDRAAGPVEFAAVGLDDTAEWSGLGALLAEQLASERGSRARPAGALLEELAPWAQLVDSFVCRCLNGDAECTAVVLAANTATMAGMFEPVSMDVAETLTALAAKCAAHIERRSAQRLIDDQLQLLRSSERRLNRVLRGTNDGWWDWDLATDGCFISQRLREMLGGSDDDSPIRSRFWESVVHPQERVRFLEELERARRGIVPHFEMEVRLLQRNGEYLTTLVRGTVTLDQARRPIRFSGSVLDLTERKRQEADIYRLAFFDPLTELPNRRLIVDRLHESVRALATSDEAIALLMLDLDRFKILNDTHGHAAGDQLLKAVAARLSGAFPSATVARLSGDEFVILLDRVGATREAASAAAEAAAQRAIDALSRPFTIDAGVVRHGASVGVTVTVDPRSTPDELLKEADLAMYRAKLAGRGRWCSFEPSMRLAVESRSKLESDLRRGHALREFRLFYQAQVDVSGALSGAEALMRWFRREGTEIPPSEFIPVAEESGLIQAIGSFGLESACQQLATWTIDPASDFRLAINISAPEFLHADFPRRLLTCLDVTDVPARLLRLELTEATVLSDLSFAARRIEEIAEWGVEFSLDDFGTGFSSLAYLRHLPVNEVKIDRSYVARFLTDRHDAAIVRSILGLCSTLGLRVVAEGVERVDEWEALIEAGCQYFQGYLFGRPMDPPGSPLALIQSD